MQFQESCYQLSDTEATRAEAAAECRPGHLVDITSREEKNFVSGLVNRSEAGGAWIGLLKTLKWSDGPLFVHEPWQNIVTNDAHSCFRLRSDRDYRWDDYDCDSMIKFVCKYEGILKC